MRVGSLRGRGAVAAIGIACACAPDASGLGTAGTGMPMDPSSTGASEGPATGTTADPAATTTTGPDDTGEVSTSTSTGDAPVADSSTSAAADTADTEAPTEVERCIMPNVPIPDAPRDGVASTIEVVLPGGGTIVELRVFVEATHTYVGDLRMLLTTPTDDAVTLLDRPGGGECSGNDIEVELHDAAAETIDVACLDMVTPALVGEAQPAQPLGPVVVGQPAAGNWRLQVIDAATNDTGMLASWCLRITYR